MQKESQRASFLNEIGNFQVRQLGRRHGSAQLGSCTCSNGWSETVTRIEKRRRGDQTLQLSPPALAWINLDMYCLGQLGHEMPGQLKQSISSHPHTLLCTSLINTSHQFTEV